MHEPLNTELADIPRSQPPLGISHLLLWIFGAAIVLGVSRWWSTSAGQSTPMIHLLMVGHAVVFSLLAGVNIAAVIVFARRLLVRDAPLLVQPGHWLLVNAGAVNVTMWLLLGGALLLRALSNAGDSQQSPPDVWLPAAAAHILAAMLNVLAVGQLRPTPRWRRYFLISALCAGLLGMVFGAISVTAIVEPYDGLTSSVPLYAYACCYPLDQLTAIALLSFNALADRADRTPRDWVHNAGVAATLLQLIASLAFLWLVQWAAAASL